MNSVRSHDLSHRTNLAFRRRYIFLSFFLSSLSLSPSLFRNKNFSQLVNTLTSLLLLVNRRWIWTLRRVCPLERLSCCIIWILHLPPQTSMYVVAKLKLIFDRYRVQPILCRGVVNLFVDDFSGEVNKVWINILHRFLSLAWGVCIVLKTVPSIYITTFRAYLHDLCLTNVVVQQLHTNTLKFNRFKVYTHVIIKDLFLSF